MEERAESTLMFSMFIERVQLRCRTFAKFIKIP